MKKDLLKILANAVTKDEVIKILNVMIPKNGKQFSQNIKDRTPGGIAVGLLVAALTVVIGAAKDMGSN